MARSRPPVWIVVLSATFVGYFCLLIYCDLVRPEPQGLNLPKISAAGAIIDAIAPNSPAARAGLRAGDVLISVDGHPVTNRFDLETIGHTIAIGRPRTYVVDRLGAQVSVVVTFARVPPAYFLTGEMLKLLFVRLIMLVTLLFGLAIAWIRPRDPAALIGALLLASAGVFCITLPNTIAVVWRSLPWLLGVTLWVPFVCSAAIGGVAFAFFSTFPTRAGRSTATTIAMLLPIAVLTLVHTSTLIRTVYRPDDLRATPFWPFQALLALNATYIAAGLVALVLNYRRLTGTTERRRVRVLLAGSLIGWIAGTPSVVLFYTHGADLRQSLFASTGATIGAFGFLVFPASFAYSILRQRLLDLGSIVRMGVQYALARRALVSLVPVLLLVLVVDLFTHAHRSMADLVVAHGPAYAIVLAAAVLAHLRRRQWLDALDRRFFRERYDARELLARLVSDLRKMGDFDAMAPRAAAQIDAALHPRFVAVFVRPMREARFTLMASVPEDREGHSIPAESTVVRVMRVLHTPMQIGQGEAAWLASQVPAPEIEQLRAAQVELLVPIVVDERRTEALVVLGAKRSEEPYSDEDRELLMTIGESLALLLDRTAAPAPADGASECPRCGSVQAFSVSRCPHDDSALVATRVPHVLGSRYRLERRLGQGGMGTVYAAMDTALDRSVAAKVLREELAADPAATERFQAEARAAARLAHPNIVTVHDFGVTPDGQGFLVMELLDGVSLRAVLRDAPLSPQRAAAIVRHVGGAVEAAHAQGLVHRDLKPENVLLLRRDNVEACKVMDFGIATLVPSIDAQPDAVAETTLVGTIAYMSPEQLARKAPAPAWDLWALGVIAFEMLTGTHPFAGLPAWIGPGFASGETDLPASPLAPLPSDWASFFASALAADASARPPSVRAWIDRFELAMGVDAARQ